MAPTSVEMTKLPRNRTAYTSRQCHRQEKSKMAQNVHLSFKIRPNPDNC